MRRWKWMILAGTLILALVIPSCDSDSDSDTPPPPPKREREKTQVNPTFVSVVSVYEARGVILSGETYGRYPGAGSGSPAASRTV